MKNPRFKWVFVLIIILTFGLPLHLLPKKIEEKGFLTKLYNKSIGNENFNNNVRPVIEKIAGGSLRMFMEDAFENSYSFEPERTSLLVTGSMPDGCTIEQLNDVIIKMETFISQFDEVELFETQISSYKESYVRIYFKENYEIGAFPYTLKSLLESKANSLGGLDWSVSGVGRGFSNSLYSGYNQQRIIMEGYNYDKLYDFAEQLKLQLTNNSNSRIKNIQITSGVGWRSNSLFEYYLDFDTNELAIARVSPDQLYGYLKNQVHSANINPIIENQELEDVKLVSNIFRKFNVWDLKNSPLTINSKSYKLNQFAFIEKRKTGNTINKNNQQYSLTVEYDFIGTQPLSEKVKEKNISIFQPRLPLGYKILKQEENKWDRKDEKQYYYLIIIAVIIYFICAILLESLKQPLVIICMIPISFIGVFLTFNLFNYNFDQGGYASFVLLCGISVNAALYILNDYNNLKMQFPNRDLISLYLKAFNSKIIPIILTIISTIVGLIPFIWNGENEAFWFAFAAGSIGGLIFSLIGILFYLPLFMEFKIKKTTCK